MAKDPSRRYVESIKKKINSALEEQRRVTSHGAVIESEFHSSKLPLPSPFTLADLNISYLGNLKSKFSYIPPAFKELSTTGLRVPKPYRFEKLRSKFVPFDNMAGVHKLLRESVIARGALNHYPGYKSPTYISPDVWGPYVFRGLFQCHMADTYGYIDGLPYYDLVDTAYLIRGKIGAFYPSWLKPSLLSPWLKRLEKEFGYPEFVSQATNPWATPDRLSSYLSLLSNDPRGTFECTDIYDQILSQYNGHKANVGMTLGEGRETFDYIKSRISSLCDLLINAKSKKPIINSKRLRSLRARDITGKLTDAQLEYQYAILPLMQDIENYISLYHRKIIPKCKGLKRYEASYDVPIPSISNEVFHDSSGPNPYAACTLDAWNVLANTPSFSGTTRFSDMTYTHEVLELEKGLITSKDVPLFIDQDPRANEYSYQIDGDDSIEASTNYYVAANGPFVSVRITDKIQKSLIFYPSAPLEFKHSLGLDFKDLPSLAWDLKSLSFVYNWFINVDEVISGFTDKTGDLKGVWVESYKIDREVSLASNPSTILWRYSAFNRQVQEKASVQGQYVLSVPTSWSQLVSLFSLSWKKVF